MGGNFLCFYSTLTSDVANGHSQIKKRINSFSLANSYENISFCSLTFTVQKTAEQVFQSSHFIMSLKPLKLLGYML